MKIGQRNSVGVDKIYCFVCHSRDIFPACSAQDLANRIIDIIDHGQNHIGIQCDYRFFAHREIAILVGKDILSPDGGQHFLHKGIISDGIDIRSAGDLHFHALFVFDACAEALQQIQFLLECINLFLARFLRSHTGRNEPHIFEHILNAGGGGNICNANADIPQRLEGIRASNGTHTGGENQISIQKRHLFRIRLHHVKGRKLLQVKIHGRVGVHSNDLILQSQVQQGLGGGGGHRNDAVYFIRQCDGISAAIRVRADVLRFLGLLRFLRLQLRIFSCGFCGRASDQCG